MKTEVDGRSVTLDIRDVSGTEDYARLRPLSYPGVNVVLMCFGIDAPDGFLNITHTWTKEARHFVSNIPFVLVGCRSELRNDKTTISSLRKAGEHPVRFDEAQALAQRIGASAYLECSAATGDGVPAVFEEAVRQAWKSNSKLPRKDSKLSRLSGRLSVFFRGSSSSQSRAG